MVETVGMQDIRGLKIEKTVTAFALREYVFKQLCTVANTSSWTNRYFEETAADLTGGAGSVVQGVPRLAVFPHGEVSFTQKNSTILKHGMEVRISTEDIKSNDVDVMMRHLLRIPRAVVKSVDTNIWNVLTENQSAVNINSTSIAAGSEWDSATIANRDPIQNILNAKRLIDEQDYNSNTNGFLLVNPKDWENLLGNANVRNAGQFFTDDVTRNGNVGFLLGLKVLVSNNVTADFAAVVIGKEACTWQALSPLRTSTIDDPGIGMTIRSYEMGVAQLKNPKACTLLDNTAK